MKCTAGLVQEYYLRNTFYIEITYLVSWHLTVTLVGSCRSLTALLDVATDCPPGPDPFATDSVTSAGSNLGYFE